MRNRGKTISELAGEAGVGGSYFTRTLRLGFLAPDVVKTILSDRHPIELTAKKLASDTRLPIVWEAQRARLAIASTTASIAARPPSLVEQAWGDALSRVKPTQIEVDGVIPSRV